MHLAVDLRVCMLVLVSDLVPDEFDDEMMLHESGVLRWVLLVTGTISLILGIIGIVLPLVPTTPFLLVSAGCYARSSKKFYVWLLSNRWFGPLIRDWRRGLGIPLRAKVIATALLTLTLGTSIVIFVPIMWVKIVLACIGVTVIGYLWQLPTRRGDQ